MDELIDRISTHDDVKRIIVGRSYEVLGGHNFRILPKELYFTDAGGAETALFIQKGKRENENIDVSYLDKQDREPHSLYTRIIQRLASYR